MDSSLMKDLEIINNKFGSGSVVIGDNINTDKIDVISTGSYGLDYKTRIWGIPVGRITEITGVPSAGKTTLALHIVANAQSNGPVCYIDAEHAIDMGYAERIGVNIDNLVFSQPTTLEQGLSILEHMLQLNKFKVIVFDSVAAIPTKKELEGDLDDRNIGDKARVMSAHCRNITPFIGKVDTALVYINQYRDKLQLGYGGGYTTPGGHALPYRSDLRIELKTAVKQVKAGDINIGTRIRAKILKNKFGVPFGEWEYTIVFGKGIDSELDLVELGIEFGVIKKSGSWYSFEGENIGQGIFNVSNNLKEDKELLNSLKNKILELVN